MFYGEMKKLEQTIKESISKLSELEDKSALKLYEDIVGTFITNISLLNESTIKLLAKNINSSIQSVADAIEPVLKDDKTTKRWMWFGEVAREKAYPYSQSTLQEHKNRNIQVYHKNLKTGFNFIQNNHLYCNLCVNRDSLTNYKKKDYERVQNLIKESKKSILKDLNIVPFKKFASYEEAKDFISEQEECVIKANNSTDGEFVFLKRNGKFYTENSHFEQEISQQDMELKFKKCGEILVESNCVYDHNRRYEYSPFRFLCGHGDVFACAIIVDNYGLKALDKALDEKYIQFLYLDENCNQLQYQIKKLNDTQKKTLNNIINKAAYKKMWNIAKELSKTFPNQRIDLFCSKQPDGTYKIYFNEIQNNNTSTYSYLLVSLSNEGIMKYNEMVNFANVPEDKLPDILKIVHKQEKKMEKKIDRSNLTIVGKPKTKVENQIESKSMNIKGKQKQQVYSINNNNTHKFNVFPTQKPKQSYKKTEENNITIAGKPKTKVEKKIERNSMTIEGKQKQQQVYSIYNNDTPNFNVISTQNKKAPLKIEKNKKLKLKLYAEPKIMSDKQTKIADHPTFIRRRNFRNDQKKTEKTPQILPIIGLNGTHKRGNNKNK